MKEFGICINHLINGTFWGCVTWKDYNGKVHTHPCLESRNPTWLLRFCNQFVISKLYDKE